MKSAEKQSEATVFLVDDDKAVRAALELMLQTAGMPVRCFGSAEEFLDQFDGREPGCLLLDVRMPGGMSGFDLQERLNKLRATLPIVFMTGHGDVPMSVRALKAGAADFVEKPFRREVLLKSLQEAISRDSETRSVSRRDAAVRKRYARLTAREREVMALILRGRTNKEIGQSLNVSHRTIEIHRSRVLAKMEAQSVPELVRLALKNDLDEGLPTL